MRVSSRPERPASRRGGRLARLRTVIGIPLPLVIAAIVLSAALGLVLSRALEASISMGATSATSTGSGLSSGNNAAGQPVVTESTLGTEVQRLFDAGTILPSTSFSADACLREQGSEDSVLIMEEVAWGEDQIPSWLLVHGPMDEASLHATGGTVSAIVVRPSCGTGTTADPREDRLWAGSVLIGQ